MARWVQPQVVAAHLLAFPGESAEGVGCGYTALEAVSDSL